MAEGAVEVVAKEVAEAAEEIVRTDHGQDRYKTRREDPLHRSLKGTRRSIQESDHSVRMIQAYRDARLFPNQQERTD